MNSKFASLSFGVLCLLAVSTVFAPYAYSQSSARLLENHTMQDDFQGDGLGQWASYPPAQDIGYEPSITPTSEFDARGGRSLMRVVQPTRNGDLRFGVIKQAGMFAGADSRIAFSYRLNDPTAGATIEVGLAGADGCLYAAGFPSKSNGWSNAEVKFSDFRCGNGRALASGTGIEAVYIVANVKNASSDVIYRFLIDDVALSGERVPEFIFKNPTAEKFEPWPAYLSTRSFGAGDSLFIEAVAPAGIRQASVVVRAADGKSVAEHKLFDDGTNGDRTANDGVWTNSAVYKFGTKDAGGIWNVDLKGTSGPGQTVSSKLRFIVRPELSTDHPRLYFGPDDKSRLLDQTRDPKLSKVWDHIKTAAKNSRANGNIAHGGDVFELLDDKYLLPTLLGYFDVINRSRSRIAYNAFVAYLTDDAEARAAAKDALMIVSNWNRWEPPWFTAHGQHTYYPAGLLAVDVALGYDLLYEHLSEAERSQVRRALIEKQIAPTYKEYFLDNRAMANTSNWISHTVGGALIAASAIAGDVKPEESGGKFDLYVNGLLSKIEAHMAASFLPDGSYGEGISYQEFDMETLAPMINSVERAFGVDYWETTQVKDSLRYAMYTLTDPREASLDMGDTHPPAGFGISPAIFRSKDPVVRWYYSRFDRPSLQHFIFYDNSVEPKSPDAAGLPNSTIFADKGNAVFRTGWGEDSVAMLYRAGPNFNHHHADQGAFLLTAFGEPLVTEAGWSDYYKDPYYATFFTQAVGHSTVLVDGDPESQTIPDTPQFRALNDYPFITDSITSEFYDGVGSELSSVYRNRLDGYSRRIVFVKPYYFVVFDGLRSAGEPTSFNFLLHLPDRAATRVDGKTAVYSGKKASLAVRWFSPENASLSLKAGRIPYPVFSARTPAETPLQPAYLDYKTAAESKAEGIVTALVPAKSESQARGMIDKMSALTGAGMRGIRVQRGDETDLIIFRTGPDAIRRGEWTADAAAVTITQTTSGPKMFAIHNARSLKDGSRSLFSSDKPVSFAANYSGDRVAAVSNAAAAAKVAISLDRAPARVFLDGRALKASEFSYDRANRSLVLTVPVGRHEVRMELK